MAKGTWAKLAAESGSAISQAEKEALSDSLRGAGYDYEDDPRTPRKGGQVMRFDGDWEKTPSGYRLKKKNIRYEDR